MSLWILSYEEVFYVAIAFASVHLTVFVVVSHMLRKIRGNDARLYTALLGENRDSWIDRVGSGGSQSDWGVLIRLIRYVLNSNIDFFPKVQKYIFIGLLALDVLLFIVVVTWMLSFVASSPFFRS